MRVAFFSPMPPSRSGIADYSEALVSQLGEIAEVQVFTSKPERVDRTSFDCALYQIGNNAHHAFAYEQALEWPGIVVMHEANLHHLLAEITIKRGDWDAYVREVEYDGGPDAAAYASRVRALEVGPDYAGVAITRRILERSRGIIVHSHFVEQQLRSAGFTGPIAVIPHGAWIPDVNGRAYRQLLGLDAATPLAGVFGFLKPYKRIAESLRAFKRLLKLEPNVKMILVGEPHPEFPLQSLIDLLGLSASVRILGFTPIEEFVGYIAACDIILNLRYPTVGESSGTLLRSLGLGKAVIVSDVGSFAEYPDDVCLKVPVDAREEETLFEYLNLLVSRPDLRNALGEHARQWVKRECNWSAVAERYLCFLRTVVEERERLPAAEAAPEPVGATAEVAEETAPEPAIHVEPEYIRGWASSDSSRQYIETHITRFQKTLEMIPPGAPDKRVLEMGAYMQITPALKHRLGYGEVRGCYYGPAGTTEHKTAESISGEHFECEIDLFDAEKDRFPYADEHFDTVLCCELIEHLTSDPMFMMSEINRILKSGGYLVLTTPNIISLRAISAMMQGYHPGFFPAYIKPAEPGAEVDARHAREYAPREIVALMGDAGFEVIRLESGEFADEPHPEHGWVRHMIEQYKHDPALRGDGIYAVAAKRGPVRERYPGWLYS
jgi:glycosyltransferase involved in cell wall biosynthesis/SAM-dependent methyltransferase